MAIFIAAIIPAIPGVVGFVFGIAKDGNPLKKDFWT